MTSNVFVVDEGNTAKGARVVRIDGVDFRPRGCTKYSH